MALYTTEDVNGNSPYAEFKIGEMEIKEAIGFMQFTKATATSAEYGDFQIEQGVRFDTEAQTEDELLASLSLVGIIFNTQLRNFVKNGAIRYETPYIISKAWNKGDKYDGNKRAKGNGFKVQKVGLPTPLLEKITAWHGEQLNIVEVSETSDAETPQQEAPKNASGVNI